MAPDDIIQFMERSQRKICIHLENLENCVLQPLAEDYKKKSLIVREIISNLNDNWKFNFIYPFKQFYDYTLFECYVFEKITLTPPLCVCGKVNLD